MPDTILVTGGAGFIGSHTCKALRRAGYRPVSFDNLSTGHADAVRFGPLVQGDVRDPRAVEAALRAHDARAVIHFAASAYVGESMADPAKYYDNNVGGMIGLVQGCRAAGVSRIVFSSSCATYGTPDRLPIRETTPQRPINPYGRTKLIGEEILRDLAVEGMRHVALRYFNAAGADPEGELGERHDPETHLLPLALRAASGQGGPLAIFGTDYPTPDGTCIRDYIHVADLARAHVLALGRLMAGGESLAVNLGTGRGQSVREIVSAIERITGRAVPVRLEARRPGDPAELVADPALAAAELGFRTRISDIASIVRHAAPRFGLEPARVEAA
ncbi:UDP-glucose 4-epimerase GalE [Cereibacter johrii]|uniref:UDP-glucose 4-epimerase GalE n=1 Tax=Cereibacter johrii TaxID=445629 RepID=UPI000DCE5A9E|nr:UDP-glucose 4-epimerase GalE [Cereibacter johrii]RAZ83763.1 UDP-glucose 4-epimerase GalE [Cereibacter johrii]RDS94439.1 UDP-glucose 4-epimerase GalE [Cereibacter sphaeroides f. sp. denitrificans]